MAFEYKNKKNVLYYLHGTMVKLKGSGRTQMIYYFARKTGKGALHEVPKGYTVVESKRTSLPLLKKS